MVPKRWWTLPYSSSFLLYANLAILYAIIDQPPDVSFLGHAARRRYRYCLGGTQRIGLLLRALYVIQVGVFAGPITLPVFPSFVASNSTRFPFTWVSLQISAVRFFYFDHKKWPRYQSIYCLYFSHVIRFRRINGDHLWDGLGGFILFGGLMPHPLRIPIPRPIRHARQFLLVGRCFSINPLPYHQNVHLFCALRFKLRAKLPRAELRKFIFRLPIFR